MSHQDLRSGKRSGEMIRENGRNPMIRKAYWGVLASILVALVFATGCSSTSATPPVTQVTTVAIPTTAPAGQNAVISTKFGSPLIALVSTNGTPVAGVTVTFSAPLPPTKTSPTGAFGSASGNNSASATTDATGTATSPDFYANGFSGTYVVIASAVGTQSTAQFSMFNTLQPQGIAVSGGTPQSTSVGQQFNSQLSVTVTNGGTSVGQGLPVTFANASSDGTFADSGTNTTVAITNASGVATAAPFVAGATATGANGQYTVTATTIDNDPNSASFTLSNTIVPATITAAGSSTPQTAAVGTPFAPLTVTVMDGSTPPVPVGGAFITFSAPSFSVTSGVDSTSSGTFADSGTTTTTAWTDANGVATAAVFTANTLPGGPYNVSATVVVKAGSTLSTNFALTNQ
jgi:hypothetical protein